MMAFPHGGFVRRVKLGILPPDWKVYAPIPIVVLLHDERSSADSELPELAALPDVNPLPLGMQLASLLFPNMLSSLGKPLPPPRPSPPPTFLLVVPEGMSLGRFEGDVGPALEIPGNLPGSPHCGWNSGHRGFDGATLGVDDVGFVEALITELQVKLTADLLRYNPTGNPATEALDLSRIYVAGTGNGGEMAYRLACGLPTRPAGYAVRGLAVIGGTVGGRSDSSNTPEGSATLFVNDPAVTESPPPDVLIVHGMLDTNFLPGDPAAPDALVVSQDEQLRMGDEVLSDFVDDCTPSDHGVDFSRDLWKDYLSSLLPAVSEKVERAVALPLPVPLATTIVRMRQFHFQPLPPPAPPSKFGPRYLTTVLDDRLAHELPLWDLGLLVWTSFATPAELVP